MRILANFMLSASDLAHFPPPSVPEIAFLGRSNVGKSSVINALVGKKLARTSNTPGRTRSINFYEVRRAGQPQPELLFTDLPGYGYAKVSREISADWARFVDPYLHQRPSLALCLALVDSNIPPQESDGQLLEFLASRGRPHAIVATKCDRLSGNQLQQAMRTLGQAYGGVPIVAFSAKTGAGKDELWNQIRAALAQFPASKVFPQSSDVTKISFLSEALVDPNIHPEQPGLSPDSGRARRRELSSPAKTPVAEGVPAERLPTAITIPAAATTGPAFKDRRQSPRLRCSGSVEFRAEGSDVRIWGTLTDISLHGCYVEMSTTFPVDARVDLD